MKGHAYRHGKAFGNNAGDSGARTLQGDGVDLPLPHAADKQVTFTQGHWRAFGTLAKSVISKPGGSLMFAKGSGI